MSVKEMLEFVQAKAIECNWYDIQDPRPSSKALEYHLKRAVDYATKRKGFTSSAPSVPINTVTFSPANGSQLATYTIHPAPLPPAPEQFRSPPGSQQAQQVSRTMAESNVTSTSSPMNALNSMITNQPRMHNPAVTLPSNSDEAMMRNRQAAERQAVERQFNTFHGAPVAQGNVPSSSAMQVVMHQQRPILQVQPLPTSTSWQMTRPPVTFVQQNRFHHMPYPPGAAPPQPQPPHGFRVSNFPGVDQQQLVMNANDLPGRTSVVRPGMPQQPQLIRQHSIPPMAGQQPMAHHSGQLPPPPAHHSQLAPVVQTMFLQTQRQHAQPQQKQQPRAVEQAPQPPQQQQQQQQQQPIVVSVYRCLKCNREADQKCSGCQNTYYCSRECQVIVKHFNILKKKNYFHFFFTWTGVALGRACQKLCKSVRVVDLEKINGRNVRTSRRSKILICPPPPSPKIII